MPVTIACFGDSTCFGWTTNGRADGPQPGADGTVQNRVDMPAPDALQTLLQMTYPTVTVVNYGSVGTTCADWLNATNGVTQRWSQEMATNNAAFVLIILGINDEPDELAANYPQLVDIAQAAGKRVIIQTPNMIDSTLVDLTSKVETERAIHAANPGSILVDFYAYTLAMGAAWHDQLSYSIMFKAQAWTGIHPTQVGYDTMAAVERDVLVPVLAGMAL
jgi:lysophospholipase L1-like esterase